MTLDDVKKIFLSPTLFRLDTILSPKLVPLLYAVGLMSLLLWAVAHLFLSFGRNFGDGLWGLFEIAVYGALGVIALRVICEVLLVFFKANEAVVRTVSLSRVSAPLIDEVRDAIHDIASASEEADDYTETEVEDLVVPSSGPIRRSARRSPPPPPPAKPDI
jgi:hypothetical protein